MIGTEFPAFAIPAIARPPAIGRVFYVQGFSGTDAVGRGTDPGNPFLTITYALAQCVAERNDYIIVIDAWNEAMPIVVDKTRVHIIGLGVSSNHPFVMLNATADTAIFDVNAASSNVEIAGFDLGGGPTHAGIENVGGAPMGLYVHDCMFGHSFAGDTPQDGILIDMSATNIRIERCVFLGNEAMGGGTLTRDGIRWDTAADPLGGVFIANTFTGLPGVGINIVSVGPNTGGFIIKNNIFMAEIADAKAAGWAITLQGPADVKGCLVVGNMASQTGDATGNNPYRDLSTGALATCLNGWVNNHDGNALSTGPAVT